MEWVPELRVKRFLWREYGIPASMTLTEAIRAWRLDTAEAKRAQTLEKRAAQQAGLNV